MSGGILTGPWDQMQALSFLLFFCFVAFQVGKQSHWSIGLCFFLTLGSAAFAIDNFVYDNSKDWMILYYMEFLPAAAIMTAAMMFIAVNKCNSDVLLKRAGYVNIFNSLLMLIQFYHRRDGFMCGGMLGNASMNCSLIAVLMPFTPVWALPLCLGAIICSQASIPVAVFMTVVFGYFLSKKQKIWQGIALIGVGAIIAYFTPTLMNDSGRYGQWSLSISYWKDHASAIWGAGAGEYYYLGYIISKIRGLQTFEIWTFMHNDWLQILFEGGILGLLSCLNVFGHMLYFTRSKPALFGAILGFSVYACFNMPMRYYIPGFIGALLVRAAFKKDVNASSPATTDI